MADILAHSLSAIKNASDIGRTSIIIRPISKLLRGVLDVMRNEGYLGEFEVVDDGRGGVVRLQLVGKINKCGVTKPQFSVKRDGYEKFEKRYLPAKDFGIIIVSTTKGLMTHMQAKKEGIGGKLIAYVY